MPLRSQNTIRRSILIAVKLDTFPHCSSHTTRLVAHLLTDGVSNPTVHTNTRHTSSCGFWAKSFSVVWDWVILVTVCFGFGSVQVIDVDVTGREMVESCFSHEKLLPARPQNWRVMHVINYKAAGRGFQRTVPTLEREMDKYLCNGGPTRLTSEVHCTAHSSKRERFPYTGIPFALLLLTSPLCKTCWMLLRFS